MQNGKISSTSTSKSSYNEATTPIFLMAEVAPAK